MEIVNSCKRNNYKNVERLLREEPEYGTILNERISEDGDTLFFYAVKSNAFETVSVLMQYNNTNVNVVNNDHMTPFIWCVENRRHDMMRLLMTNDKINVNAVPHECLTPIHIAVMNNDVEAVKILTADPAVDINVTMYSDHANTHLTPYIVCLFVNSSMFKLFAETGRIDWDKTYGVNNNTIFHLVCDQSSKKNSIGILRMLRSYNPSFSLQKINRNGITIMELAKKNLNYNFNDSLLDTSYLIHLLLFNTFL